MDNFSHVTRQQQQQQHGVNALSESGTRTAGSLAGLLRQTANVNLHISTPTLVSRLFYCGNTDVN